MADDTLKLTDQKVLSYAQALLEEHLPLEAEGYSCTTDDLLNVLLDRKSTRLNSSHIQKSRMPSSA